MSAINRIPSTEALHRGVLIVSDAEDGEVRDFVTALLEAGVQVRQAADVYAAAAMLTRGLAVNRVIVDARTLDDKELAFLRLVPRFFPRCAIIVPSFCGTGDRAAFRPAGVQPVPVPTTLEETIAQCSPKAIPGVDMSLRPPPAAAAAAGPPDDFKSADSDERLEEPSVDADRFPIEPDGQETKPLSTDGGTEAADSGPSMHEAVRRRMAGDGGAIRRTPPRAPPCSRPPSTPAPENVCRDRTPAGTTAPLLSPEELDALLHDEEGAAG